MATVQKQGDLQWRARVRRRGYPVQTKSSGDNKLDSHQMQPILHLRYVTCEQFPVGIDCKRLAIGGCQIVDGVIRSSKRSRRVLDRQEVIGGIITVARPAAIYGRSRPGGFLPRINQRKVLEGEIAYVAGYERKVVDQRRGGQKAINRWKGTAGLGHKTSPAVGSLGIYGQDTPGKENRQFRFQPVDKPVATLSLFDDLNPLAQFA